MAAVTDLTNKRIADSYIQLLHTGEDGGLTSSPLQIYDGDGTGSALKLATTSINMADSHVLKLGTGNDLTLYHDGSNSYLTNAVGALKVATETSGIAVTIGHTTSETTVADNLTVTGNASIGGNFDVSGTLDFSDSAITNVGSMQLDSIAGDADTNTSLTFSGSDVITIANAGTDQITFNDGSILPVTDNDIDLGSSSYEFKDGYFDGTVYADAINFNGTAIASTAAELNIVDGGTSATGTTLADADRVVVNDNGTMVQVALTDFETYMETSLDTLSSVTTVGALNSGSISSGFGAIDIGSSALSTTGSVTLGATSFGDNDITNVGDINVDSISVDAAAAGLEIAFGGNTTTNKISLTDNLADALNITESSNSYIKFITTNSGEKIQIAKALDIDAVSDFGSNAMTNVNVDSGAIDGTAIGANSAAAGTFAALVGTSLSVSDGAITNVSDIALDSISADGTDINIAVSDNSATALTIKQGSDAYLIVDTANSSESVSIGTGISGTAITIGHGTSEVTIGDNLTVSGDLTISGGTTTVSTTNLLVEDPLTILNVYDSQPSNNAYDTGIIMKRGSSDSAPANVGMIWDESTNQFAFIDTTDAGTTAGNVTITDYENLRVGALTADDASTFTSTISAATGSTIGNLTLANGSITDSSGAIDFGNETLATSGVITGGGFTIGSAAILEAELEILDGAAVTTAELNIIDGDTSATGTTLATADRVVVNDNGTMVQVAMSDFETFMESNLDTLSSVTTVGALNAGSITSGFGTIDIGSSTFTTTGAVTGGSLVVDNITINGNDISSTGGTDLTITPLSGQQIVLDGTIVIDAGVVTGATSITSTAFVGDITGDVTGTADTATLATSFTASANNSTDETVYPVFVDGATGSQGAETDTGWTYNPSSGLLTISGELDAGSLDISGNADIDGTLETDNLTVGGDQGSDGEVLTSTGSGVAWEAVSSAAISATANGSNNRIATYSASTALNGEANLTFDGSTLTCTGSILPGADDSTDLGSASYQWRNIYTGDLNLNNTRGDGNEVDGTSGSWTIQEGADDLFLINRETGKKYKFQLQEID